MERGGTWGEGSKADQNRLGVQANQGLGRLSYEEKLAAEPRNLGQDFEALGQAIEALRIELADMAHRLEPVCRPEPDRSPRAMQPKDQNRSPLGMALSGWADTVEELRGMVISLKLRLEV